VWYWSTKAGGSAMKLDVLLDQKVIFTTSLTFGRLVRSAAEKDYSAKPLSFSFKARRPIKWLGYRDDEPVTPRDQDIECNIWMAGSDERFVILGIDFHNSETGLMNSLHLALAAERSSSEMEAGLVFVTYPIEEHKMSNHVPDPTSPSVTPPAGAGGAPSVAADH
jgi:hypothetical protein